MKLTLLLLAIPALSLADNKAPAPALQKFNYKLKDLVPYSISVYPAASPTALRHYLQFRNQDGSHYFVYEEDDKQAPVKEAKELKLAAETWAVTCNVDLECLSKPFCTGNCKNMYYQVANPPLDATPNSKAQCHIPSFTCTKRGEIVQAPEMPPSAAPAAPPAPASPTVQAPPVPQAVAPGAKALPAPAPPAAAPAKK